MIAKQLISLRRWAYRRLRVVLVTVCLMVVVLCFVNSFQYDRHHRQVARISGYNGRLRWEQSAPTTRPLEGAMDNIHIKHQYEEWLKAEKEKHANGSYDLRQESEFMRQQALVQRKRKRTLRAACRRYPELANFNFTKYNIRNMYALDKNRLFYCAVPKAGCTNWKKVLMVLEGEREHVWNITGRDAHFGGHLQSLKSLSLTEKKQVLYTYPKFVYVRHPFIRLISAYRNKIARNMSQQGKTFQGYARRIVTKYRKGALMADLEAGGNFNVTWDEWIRYLTDPSEIHGFDQHWQEFYKLCLPCRINYDFIGNLDTVLADSTYMLGFLGLNKVSYPASAVTSSSIFYDQYFANVSRQDLQKLWEIYKFDFELFGYAKPDEIVGELL